MNDASAKQEYFWNYMWQGYFLPILKSDGIMHGKSSRDGAKALCDYIHCPWLKPGAMDVIIYIGNNFFGRGINEVLFFLFLNQNVSLET